MKRSAPGSGADAPAGLPSLDYNHICEVIEKRLFVGRVPPGTTEEEFQAAFEAYGPLTECRLVAKPSGNSIGFVAYKLWASAHNALLECDGKRQLSGHSGDQSVVVSFAERKEAGRGSGLAYAKGLDISRLFVGRIPEDATEAELLDRFSPFGEVESVTLMPPKGGKGRCAFVTFPTWGQAMDAVENLTGAALRHGDPPMSVVLAEPRGRERESARGSRSAEEPSAKRRRGGGGAVDVTALLESYVAGVQGDATRQQLDLLHEQLMHAREQAFAPAYYGGGGGAYSGGAARHEPHWSAAPAGVGGDRDAARLFVGGLPADLSDDELRQLAEQLELSLPPQATELLECRVLPGKGCGYLRYSTWEAAEQAFECLNDREVAGWQQILRVKWATPQPGGRGRERQRDGHGRDEERGGRGSGGYGGHRDGGHRDGGRRDSGHGSRGDTRGSSRSGGHHSNTVTMPTLGERQAPVDALCYAGQAEIEAQGLEATRLFVGQLNRDIHDVSVALKPLFEQFGHTTEFRHMKDKGILYVSYNTVQEAQTAMEALANRPISGLSKCLNVKFSQRRNS